MSNSTKERGSATFKALLALALLAAGLHMAFKMGAPFISENALKDKMSEQAALAKKLTDAEIIDNIASKAKELDIPLRPDDIHLVRDDVKRSMQISAQWDVTVSFFFGATERVFHFAPVVKEHYTVEL